MIMNDLYDANAKPDSIVGGLRRVGLGGRSRSNWRHPLFDRRTIGRPL